MCRRARAFTLIEVLVTLAVLGICVALVAVYAIPDERTRLRLEAERLAQLLDLAAIEARLTATTIGWTPAPGGYRFLRYNDEVGWSELGESQALRPRVFPPGVELADVAVDNARQGAATSLVFRPNAPAPAFSIDLAASAERLRVVGSPVGEVRIVESGMETHGSAAAQR